MSTKITKFVISIIIIIIAISYLFIPLLNKNYFNEISTIDEFYSLDNTFIYFGSPDCPSCEGFKPILEQFAKRNMYEIHYFNLKYLIENNLVTEKELDKIIKDYKIEQIPILIEVRDKENNGSIIAHAYSIRGEEHVKEQLEHFFQGSPFKHIPVFDIHNIINLIIYTSFYVIIIVSIFMSTKYSKITYFIILTLLIWNCINMWNYGVFIDENNAGVTHHIGYLGWINMFLALVAFFTRKFFRGGNRKNDKKNI
jgi:thiol-disulfide isomerase/thioredoxin